MNKEKIKEEYTRIQNNIIKLYEEDIEFTNLNDTNLTILYWLRYEKERFKGYLEKVELIEKRDLLPLTIKKSAIKELRGRITLSEDIRRNRQKLTEPKLQGDGTWKRAYIPTDEEIQRQRRIKRKMLRETINEL